MNTSVHVNLGPRSYTIHLASQGFRAFVQQCCPTARQFLIVCDENTQSLAEQLQAELPQAALATVPAGEASKSLAQLAKLYDALASLPADRGTPVIAVGGGVVGDLAGFAAATYNRGLPLIMVPTTLLSMVDSSVGGKTGINLPQGKNLVGSFHQPAGVWINLRVLNSLPDREYRSGLAEVVKYGVILDPEFFAFLEANIPQILAREEATLTHIVRRSCELKAQVVEQDEREETGVRAVLNYGHTFGHAFETVGGYGTWRHGEAVAAGMVCASQVAAELGRIPHELTQRQRAVLQALELPTQPLQEWVPQEMLNVMRRDKKSEAGQLRLVLPTRLGQVELVRGVPEELVLKILRG